MGTPRTPQHFGAVRGERQAQVGSSGFWAVFILCNDEREDEGRQGHTHSTCHGTGAPTPTVWRRTAAASVVRRHGNTSEPAWQRTAGAPLGAATPTSTQGFLSSNGHASSAVAFRRLKASSQHGAWSQRPSRRKLTVSSCRLRHRPRFLVLLQTGPRHQARGPLALAPRTSRRTTALLRASHRSFCCAGASSFRRTTTTAGGLSHSRPKNLSHAILACDSS